MDGVVKEIITENIIHNCVSIHDEDELNQLKEKLFNSGNDYSLLIDRNLVYDKLADIFDYAEENELINKIIEYIKDADYSTLFSIYAYYSFDEIAQEIIDEEIDYQDEHE